MSEGRGSQLVPLITECGIIFIVILEYIILILVYILRGGSSYLNI